MQLAWHGFYWKHGNTVFSVGKRFDTAVKLVTAALNFSQKKNNEICISKGYTRVFILILLLGLGFYFFFGTAVAKNQFFKTPNRLKIDRIQPI